MNKYYSKVNFNVNCKHICMNKALLGQYIMSVYIHEVCVSTTVLLLLLLLSLAPHPSLGPGLLHKIRLGFLEASQQFSFLQGRVVSPTPNPYPGGRGICIYIPQRQGGYPF
jgi:hypothetical protein